MGRKKEGKETLLEAKNQYLKWNALRKVRALEDDHARNKNNI